jgi:hypothetical protein
MPEQAVWSSGRLVFHLCEFERMLSEHPSCSDISANDIERLEKTAAIGLSKKQFQYCGDGPPDLLVGHLLVHND